MSMNTKNKLHNNKEVSTAHTFANLQEFFSEIYEGSFKRKSLSSKEISTMESAPSVTLLEKSYINELVLKDISLQKTKQILAITCMVSNSLKTRIKLLLCSLLQNHPSFTLSKLTDILDNCSDINIREQAITTLIQTDFSSFSEQNISKENTFECVLLLLYIENIPEIEIFKYINLYQENSFHRFSMKDLICSKDKLNLSVIYKAMYLQCSQLENKLEDEIHKASLKEIAIRKLENKVFELCSQIESMEKYIGSIKQELENNEKELQKTSTLADNSLKQFKGKVQNRLIQEIDMLENGLQALRRTPPKVNVMIDHAERAINGLKSITQKGT